MLEISPTLSIPDAEIELTGIRAQGAGGQNVNKVSSAVHLRFSIPSSSLPEEIRQRLLDLKDRRINKDGVLVIKAQRYRTREQNSDDARERLAALILKAAEQPKPRRATRPTRAARQRRVDTKVLRGRTKALRGRVPPQD